MGFTKLAISKSNTQTTNVEHPLWATSCGIKVWCKMWEPLQESDCLVEEMRDAPGSRASGVVIHMCNV